MAMSLIQACRSLALSTWLLSFCFVHLLCLDFTVAEKEEWYTAFVNITYAEPAPDPGPGVAGGGGTELHTEKTECGRYGEHSPKQDARGEVVMASSAHDRLACDPNTKFAAPAHGKNWIALIPKGNCTYKDKIRNAFLQNASAVVIFNVGSNTNETITMSHAGVEDIVAIMIPEPKGKEIVSLLERNITVTMYITIGTRNLQKYVSRTSVVFVSISFIVLMIISLAWLVFYYIQRFRYANARDRNQRRLGDAAKKAISKLQVRTIKKGDKETEPDFDNCAVCIEGYKPNDVVRILPCRHLFHKSCVDPWLLDHRTCPMCKMNILKALGIPPNADCMDDLPTDFEGSLGGPPTNQITGASDTTVNESSVTLDPAVRTVGALQVVPDTDPTPQEGEVIFTTNSEQEPAVSSDSDISLIMAMEVGLSDVELSTDQDCEEVKS
ncbi:RING finger protein 150 isoform X1 [Panthera pardus]|uniref:RING-type domain-containing protein n=5 Tax=Felidae TaxID=9681 RepID=A0ABI7VS41_FELCA|nr:RING finger protein 150 [Panthera tigris]XP_019275744.2 RING finger protein 150 isoform X1 [Panthera pardus]XP_026922363.1 RING finger protein 150 isoform X1 [Acinonyx jubatus]XP_030168879.1 RING finger protein 150 [Lynx canadensis]XP_040329249.1 RING finger protein 150 isoform X1 [Puma yagouaroundi]XP_042791363.1 RING finger protein 150 [Panthera leo]XP_044911761.1 RING finger protein 150 isoform X2 [Felis catus]XP_045322907.1 RING finger protein 150 isoform X1 [Leopardus geoffroyi]XP_0